ncbi:hypothetical protein HQO26_02665 [Rhodococcus fascians]|nr:hypothetical protein [Rhodococcus fascians]MBY4416342.1 hypothetical protein [Rhodococcus fascians]
MPTARINSSAVCPGAVSPESTAASSSAPHTTRSIALGVSFEEPEKTRNDIGDAVAAGFDHVVLILPGPYSDGIARRVTEEFIGRS